MHDFVTWRSFDTTLWARLHFVVPQDHTENLVWAATVRGSGTRACAGCPLNDAGELLHKFSLPVDTYMDDYYSEWCRPWRLVVTATRPDGKMCMLVDVRGSSILSFEIGGDTCTADAPFRIVEGDERTRTAICSSGRTNRWTATRWRADDPLAADGRGLGDEEDDEEGFVHENEEAADDQEAKERLETFQESGGFESSGALYEISLNFSIEEDGSDETFFMLEPPPPDWIAQRLSMLRWI